MSNFEGLLADWLEDNYFFFAHLRCGVECSHRVHAHDAVHELKQLIDKHHRVTDMVATDSKPPQQPSNPPSPSKLT